MSMNEPTQHELSLFSNGKCLEAIDAFRDRVGSHSSMEDARNIFLQSCHQASWPYMGSVLMPDELAAMYKNNLIQAIKLFRARTGEGLKASKDICEAAVPVSERDPRLTMDQEDKLRAGKTYEVVRELQTKYKLDWNAAIKLCDKAVPVSAVSAPAPLQKKQTFDASQFCSEEYSCGGGDMKQKTVALLNEERGALGDKYAQLKAMLDHLIKRVGGL